MMAAVAIVLLLVTAPMIQGQAQPDLELEQRVQALEKRGEEQQDLISSLLQRLDGQDTKLQTQSRLLQKQNEQLQTQSRLLQKQNEQLQTQSRLLQKQNEQLQTQSERLDAQQLLLQDYARDTQKLNTLLWRQSARKKTHGSEDTRKRPHGVIIPFYDQVQDVDGVEHKTDTNGVVSSTQTERTHTKSKLSKAREGISSRAALDNLGSSTGSNRSKRLVLDAEGPIAFQAVIAKGEVAHIGSNQNIVFETVIENLGGGYHKQHGIFIAPANGVYIFSVSIMSYVDDHAEFRADLKKDGVILARAFGHGDSGRHDQGSVTVATQLQKGNEVWVSLEYPNDGSIYGDRYSSFMNCLVYPL